MPAKSSFPPLDIARPIARALLVKSRKEYLDWHKENKCDYLPRFPNRVYKDWISWNDFLGNENTFQMRKEFRPFEEAVKWSHMNATEHNLDTMQQYLDWVNKDDDNLPDDIPRRPDVTYGVDWKGWVYWLGSDARARLEAAKAPTHIFCICSNTNLGVPGNYYTFIHCKMGESELVEKLKHPAMKDVRVYRAYKWEEEQQDKVLDLFKFMCKDKGEGKIFIPNLNALLFELDTLLLWHPLPDLSRKVPPQPEIDPAPFMFPDGVYRKPI